jgi:copper chaperone
MTTLIYTPRGYSDPVNMPSVDLQPSGSNMNTSSNISTFQVIGMTCSHCVNAVTQEISKLDGVTHVDVDLGTGLVTVDSQQPVDPESVAAAVDEAGYEVAT